MPNRIPTYQSLLKNMDAVEVCVWAITEFGVENIALASSISLEDQVLTDMLWALNKQAQVFTLDTGRLPYETYETIERTNQHYHRQIQIMFPNSDLVAQMTTDYGPNLFYKSIEQRKLCCQIRKVEPLQQRLRTLKAWLTGLRKEQSLTRDNLELVEWDERNKIIKINPLANWTEQQVRTYLKQHKVPYNPLFDQGYPSIGCAPCTRAIKAGEELRAGRWWWEAPEHKECGLHLKDGKLIKKEAK